MSEQETVDGECKKIPAPWPFEMTAPISGRALSAFLNGYAAMYASVFSGTVADKSEFSLPEMSVKACGENEWRHSFQILTDLTNGHPVVATVAASAKTEEPTRDLLPEFVENATDNLHASLVQAYMYFLLINHFKTELEEIEK